MVSDECFAIPADYNERSQGYSQLASEEDEQLQLAIRQSLLDQAATDPAEGEQQVNSSHLVLDCVLRLPSASLTANIHRDA